MLDNIISIFIDLFASIIIYILAVIIGVVFVKRKNEFTIPIIFGLMFGVYTFFRSKWAKV